MKNLSKIGLTIAGGVLSLAAFAVGIVSSFVSEKKQELIIDEKVTEKLHELLGNGASDNILDITNNG